MNTTQNPPAKMFSNVMEIIQDEHFQKFVHNEIESLNNKRLLRPSAPKGMKYKRNWMDRMNSNNQLNASFFIKNIPFIWAKKSQLNSETRNVIEIVCNTALTKTIQLRSLQNQSDTPTNPPKTKKSKTSKQKNKPQSATQNH